MVTDPTVGNAAQIIAAILALGARARRWEKTWKHKLNNVESKKCRNMTFVATKFDRKESKALGRLSCDFFLSFQP